MDERVRFLGDYLTGGLTMSELCDRYGISRPTGYKWVGRYQAEGLDGLRERSRRPQTSPQTTAPELAALVVALRRRHPDWGGRKLIARLAAREPRRAWPAASTATAILHRHGLIEARRRRRRPPPGERPAGPIERANAVWTIDFKGQFRTGDGAWCYPLTVMDAWSRFLLTCTALPAPRRAATQSVLTRVFREYGLPDRIRSDNGPPFASTGVGRLSTLAVWWIRLGIRPELITPGRPAENGRHERMHKTLKRRATQPPAASRRAQQRRFAAFRREYNDERPHEALEQLTPASLYEPARRIFPATLPPMIYPAHFDVRRVVATGCFKWRSRPIFLSETLCGEDVGFEALADGEWAVYFGPQRLGIFDEQLGRIRTSQLR